MQLVYLTMVQIHANFASFRRTGDSTGGCATFGRTGDNTGRRATFDRDWECLGL